eukprot:4964504-Amphidinium_carterae.1
MRVANFRSIHYTKSLQSSLKVFSDEYARSVLPDQVIWFIYDAGKTGNAAAHMAAFHDENNKQIQRSRDKVLITYSQTSLQNRLNRRRKSTCGGIQIETVTLVTQGGIQASEVPRIHYDGFANGEFLPCSWPRWVQLVA